MSTPPVNSCNSSAGLIEKYINSAYDNVKSVADNLNFLHDLYEFLVQYGLTTNIAVKAPVQIVSTSPITLAGNQTISWSAHSGDYTIAAVTGNRVLVMGQTNPVENGIYNVQIGAWTRAVDFDGPLDIVDGTLVFSTQGDAWQVDGPQYALVPGVDPITFKDIDLFAFSAVQEATAKAIEAAEKAAEAAASAASALESKESAEASMSAAANSEQLAANSANSAADSQAAANVSQAAAKDSEDAAKASETAAANSASLAESVVENDRTFANVSAGLAGTTSGQYFRVPQGSGSSTSFIYYLNNSGVAEKVAELVGKGAITNNIRIYMTMDAAVADLSNILENSAAFVRNIDNSVIADEYINVSGTLTATGRRIISDASVSKLTPLIPLADSTLFRTMKELNDEFDYVLLDGQYGILLSVKGTMFDFSELSINGMQVDPAGILPSSDKENLVVLSDTTEFNSPGGKYELNPATYVMLDENFNILFDIDEYAEHAKQWQLAYEFSLQPPKENPYAPFTQVDSNGHSQIRVYDKVNMKEIAVTSGESNESNPRPEVYDSIVWTSDRDDGAPGGLYYAKGPEFKEYPYISKSKIVGWGHSFMENGRFLTKLAQLTGLYTYNLGKSGLTSEGIASRQGGARTSYVPTGGVIPESGAVTLSPAKPGPNRIYGNAAATSIACSFAGVDGIFGWDGTNATFTRTVDGAAVMVSEPTPIMVYPITNASVTGGAPKDTRYDQHDECINLIWAGRNNISESSLIIDNVKAMVDYLKPIGKRFVILPEFPGSSEITGTTGNNNVLLVNQLYKETFPENYCEIDGVDLLANFRNHHNPAFAGDLEDIANGVTPRSLRYDYLHPSQSIAGSNSPENALYAGVDVNAEFVYNFMKLKGWIL